MFSWLEYIECEEDEPIEIVNTLTPIHKEMKYFTGHYITGKERYTRLTVTSQIIQAQDKFIEIIVDIIVDKVQLVCPEKYKDVKNVIN